MNSEIKARWVARLRDPNIKQGKGRLCTLTPEGEELYCCLGVLAEIAVEAGVIPPGGLDLGPNPIQKAYPSEGGPEDAVLPPEVVLWAEVPDCNPDVVVHATTATTLATLNDQGASFAEIADLIEEQL